MPTLDSKKPEAVVSIKEFGGFVTPADLQDVPLSMAVKEVNATSVRHGELRAAVM